MSVGMKELLCSKCRKKVSYHIFKRLAKTIIKDIGRKGIGKVLYTIIIAGIITVVLNPSVRLFFAIFRHNLVNNNCNVFQCVQQGVF